MENWSGISKATQGASKWARAKEWLAVLLVQQNIGTGEKSGREHSIKQLNRQIYQLLH